MACNVVYKGKEYSFSEFATALHDGLLEDMIENGELEGFDAPKMTGVKNEETSKLREKYGLPPLEEQMSLSWETQSLTAETIVQETPEIALKIINDIGLGNKVAGPIDQWIFSHYIASLNAKLEQKITPELLDELNRVTKIANEDAGRVVAQSLNARKGMVEIKDSLGGFLQDMRDYLGAPLTDTETSYVQGFYDKYKKAKEEVSQESSELENVAFKDKVNDNFEQLKKEVGKLKKEIEKLKKDIEDLKGGGAQKRKAQANKIRKKYKSKPKAFSLKDKDGNDVIMSSDDVKANGITQDALIEMIARAVEAYGVIEDAIADVIRQVKDTDWYKRLSREGEDQFRGIIENIINGKEDYNSLIAEIKESISKNGLEAYTAKKIKKAITALIADGNESLNSISENISNDLDGLIKPEDVIDVLGGKYNEKITKGALEAKVSQMRNYAKLLVKLKNLENGTYIPAGKNKDIKVRQEIESIKSQIAEIEKANGITAEKSLDRKAKIAETKINQYREKIQNKDFSDPVKHSLFNDPIVREKHPDKIKSLQSKMRELRNLKIEYDEQKQAFVEENRTKLEKTIDGFAKTYNTIGKASGTLDLSFMGVHAFYVLFTHPRTWSKGLIEGIKQAFSKEKFKEAIESLRNDTVYWDTIEGSGLDIMDIDALKEAQRDDQLRRTWFDEHTVGGKKVNIGKYLGTEISDRAFVAMGNVIRLRLFDNFTEDLYREGKTIYTHPKEFKSVAKYVNNLTGRGKVSEEVNGKVVKFFIWSPSKMASRLSMLGLSDLVHAPMDAKRREEAKRTGKEYENRGFYSSLDNKMRKQATIDISKVIGGGLAVIALSSLMGADVDDEPNSPTFGFITYPNGWTFQAFGEMGGIVRLILKVMGIKRSQKRTSAEEVTRYLRGKFHPIPRLAADIGYGTSFMGDQVRDINGDISSDWLINSLTPMSINSITEALQDDPLNNSFLIPFQMTGLPMSSQSVYEKKYIKNYYERQMIRKMKEPEETLNEKMMRREEKMRIKELQAKYPQ